MKNNILEKRLFANTILNENGFVIKQNKKWVEVISEILFGVVFIAGLALIVFLSQFI